jgi:hypothetical protein
MSKDVKEQDCVILMKLALDDHQKGLGLFCCSVWFSVGH